MIKDDRYSKDFGAYMMKETRKQKIVSLITTIVGGIAIAVVFYFLLVGYMAAFAD